MKKHAKMKLFAFVALLFFFSVPHAFAQKNSVTINLKNASLKEVLNVIEKQTTYRFSYRDVVIDSVKNITISKKGASVSAVLDEALAGRALQYRIVSAKSIVISEKRAQPAPPANSGQKQVSGMVVDDYGDPVIGANVVEQGTTNGVSTDANGLFSLSVSGNAVLQVSYIGYITREIAVGNQTTLNILLMEDLQALDEVVVVGYGTMKKQDLTGSVIKADLNAVKDAPNTSIVQAMHGTVAGMQISQTNSAGQDPTIGVRGQNTINGSSSPLIVLDGIIYIGRISDINPSDIESIDILKDASSKAVYGAKAANGVLIITSKNGKREQAPKISYSSNWAFSNPTVNNRPLNREEWLQKVRDIEYESAYTKESGYLTLNPDWDFTQTQMNVAQRNGIANGTDYDWWENSTQTGHLFTNVVNINGGSESVSYFLSGSWTDQQSLIKNDKYKRTTFRMNMDVQATSWLKIGTNTFLSFLDFSGDSPSMGSIARMPPVVAPKDENGNWEVNPNGSLLTNPFFNYLSEDSDKRHQVNTTVYGLVSIPWVKGLTYRLNYNYTLDATNQYNYNQYEASLEGEASKIHENYSFWLVDNIVNYTNLFGKHSVNATLVYGANRNTADRTTARGEQYTSTATGYNNLSQAIIQRIGSSAWEESNLYQMARLSYGYDSKYLLTSTLRRDGFSGFAADHKFGLFPSVGLGWVISRESFMEKAKFVDNLKVRASFGVTGNQTSRYSSLAKVSLGGSYNYIFGDGSSTALGSNVSSMANNDLKWETTAEYNVGVDFSFLKERITGSVDFYRANTKDLLWDVVIPSMTGFGSVRSNVGELQNTGLEVVIGVSPFKTKDFQWNLNFNFATNKNKIVSLLGLDSDGDGKEDDLVASNLFIGESISTIYGFEIEDIWQLEDKENGTIMEGFYPGTYKLKDQNGDGEITAAEDRVILGHYEPAYYMGIANEFSYKNFDLRFFINLVQGGKKRYRGYNVKPNYLGNSIGNAENQSWINAYDYWSPSNPNATFAIAWVSPKVDADIIQDRSFVRLQDVSLSYTLEKKWINKIGLNDLRLFVSGQNLLTFTKWDGWDPEIGLGATSTDNPVMRTFAFGIDVTF